MWVPGVHPDIPGSTILPNGWSGGIETQFETEGVTPVLKVIVYDNGNGHKD